MSTQSEPGQLVAAIFDELVTRLAKAPPAQTDGQHLP
jgi:hypothetical protein